MPSQTRCPRTNNSFIHFVYGNHTDSEGGWNCADTTRSDGLHKFGGASGSV